MFGRSTFQKERDPLHKEEYVNFTVRREYRKYRRQDKTLLGKKKAYTANREVT